MAKYTVKVGFTDRYENCTYSAGETVEFSEERAEEIKAALGEDALEKEAKAKKETKAKKEIVEEEVE